MSNLKLNFPSNVKKTGYYKVGREVDGIKDEIEVLIWADSDLEVETEVENDPPSAKYEHAPEDSNELAMS